MRRASHHTRRIARSGIEGTPAVGAVALITQPAATSAITLDLELEAPSSAVGGCRHSIVRGFACNKGGHSPPYRARDQPASRLVGFAVEAGMW